MRTIIVFVISCVLVVGGYAQDSEDFQSHGDRMIKAKRYQRAVLAYKKAIDLDSTNPNAHFKCALAYYGLANLIEARKHFNKAIEKNNDYTLARYQRSMLLIHMQQYGEAMQDLDYILKKAPNDTNFIYLKCIALYHYGEYEEAISLYERLKVLRNKHPVDDFLFIGNCHLHLKQNKEAIELYEKVLASDPKNYEALVNRAFALLYAGKRKEACKEFRSFVESGYKAEAVVTSIADHCE